MSSKSFDRTQTSGFTLIEALVVVSILAALASMAVPSFQSAIERYRVTAIYDDLRATFLFARSEAIRTRSPVIVQRTAGAACATSAEWQCGYTVSVVLNGVIQPPVKTIEATPLNYSIMTGKAPPVASVSFDRWGNMTPLGAIRQVIAPPDGISSAATVTLCASSGGRIRMIPGSPVCPAN